jgi:hypothetical protein
MFTASQGVCRNSSVHGSNGKSVWLSHDGFTTHIYNELSSSPVVRTAFVKLFPAAMTGMATSQDLHLVLLSLSSTWHLVQLHSTFDFLVDAALDDHFYDTMSTISTGAMDDDIRCMASLILDFADRVRND